jgi:hypothetical protein
METQDFRNYNVSAKVTARQRKLYSELAKEAGLSLSEWIGSTIDMSIENQLMLKTKRIESRRIERDNHKNNIDRKDMVYFNKGSIINTSTNQNKIQLVKNNSTHQKAPQSEKQYPKQFIKEINAHKSTANALNTIGVFAFIASILLKQN